MRVAVIDIGTNSTRLLLAEVDPHTGALTELERRSEVTRLGVGVDRTGRLSDAGIDRVVAVLDAYAAAIEAHGGAERRIAVLTSAVRDADNGPAFAARVREAYDLDARTLRGDEEARLSFLGAVSGRADAGRTIVVLDIGGGSTEFIVGHDGAVGFHVSTQAGVVRQSERHLLHDPPQAGEQAALAAEVRELFTAAVPPEVRASAEAMVAVAGTATSMASIDQALPVYDPRKVHGHLVTLERCEEIRDRLAALTDEQRRRVPGLHPDRAPTIVAGSILLVEALRAFGLEAAEVSEHDILHGVALEAAARNGV